MRTVMYYFALLVTATVLAVDGMPGGVTMRTVTSYFVLLGPVAILAVDGIVLWAWGIDSTITGVVRGWAKQSAWPELLFVLGAGLLYCHLFRGWM